MIFNSFEEFKNEYNNNFKIDDYKESVEKLLNSYYNKNVGLTFQDILKVVVMENNK